MPMVHKYDLTSVFITICIRYFILEIIHNCSWVCPFDTSFQAVNDSLIIPIIANFDSATILQHFYNLSLFCYTEEFHDLFICPFC